jgi:hypothetical protein
LLKKNQRCAGSHDLAFILQNALNNVNELPSLGSMQYKRGGNARFNGKAELA